jgi:hypothetical protein
VADILHEGIDFAQAARDADALVKGAAQVLNAQDVLNAPTFNRVDTSSSKRELEKARASRDISDLTLDTEQQRYSSASEDEKAAITKGGRAQADLEKANQERAQKEADLYKSYALMFGIDVDPSSDIANVASELRKMRPGVNQKLTKIQQMQSVSITDNPLDWLANQVQLPHAIADYNRDADKINSMQDSIDKGIQTAQAAANLGAKGIPTITEAQAAAAANLALSTAARAKAKVDEDLARVNVDFASKRLAGDLSIATSTREMTALEIKQNELEFMGQIQAIQLADTHANRLLRAAELMEKLGRTKALDLVLEQYDKNTGHPPGTTNRFVFERMPSGLRDNIIAIGAGSAGTNPYEFLTNFGHARPGPLLSPETGRLFNFIQEKFQSIPETLDIKIKAAPKETHAASYAQYLSLAIESEKKEAYKPGNLFYELEPSKMIASEVIPADSKLAKVLEPLTATKGPIPTNVIIEAINNEWKNPSEAGQVIAEYYKRNIELRNKSLNLGLAGVKAPTDYTIPLRRQIYAFKLSAGRFDLTKPEEATKYVLATRTQDAIEAQQSAASQNSVTVP